MFTVPPHVVTDLGWNIKVNIRADNIPNPGSWHFYVDHLVESVYPLPWSGFISDMI